MINCYGNGMDAFFLKRLRNGKVEMRFIHWTGKERPSYFQDES